MGISEFRKDLVSGDWTLIATERAKRPGAHESQNGHEESYQPKEQCPFEDPIAAGNGEPLAVYNEGQSVPLAGAFSGPWTTMVVRNKYPALQPGVCGEPVQHGPFLVQAANGFHELVITRDHDRHFAHFSTDETAEVLSVYQNRYRVIAKDSCGDYVSIFHNHGRSAGASIYHNHSQILSTPVVPPEVLRSLEGADHYYQQHGATVHCTLIQWEREQRKRVVFENDRCIVFCPFVSKSPYELRIFPKQHSARFENATAEDLHACAEALNAALRALAGALNDPAYNFYIHTAPVEKDPTINYDFYHWHLEIAPVVKVDAGFERSTGLFVNPIDPDEAAAKLRDVLA